MSLTESDLDRIQERTELAMMKALEDHRQKFHAPEAAACEARAVALHKRLDALKDRVDKAQWILAGATGLVLLPWKKLVAFFSAMKGL